MFPPARFCLVKLNASTQKADGLISAQISEVLFGMLSLHLSGQRPGFTPLAPARSCCCRCRCRCCSGGSEVEERGPAWRSNKDCEEFKTKCRFTPTSGSGIYWKEASTCWDLLCSRNSSPITKQTQHFKDEMFNYPNKSFLEVWGLFGAPLFYFFPSI